MTDVASSSVESSITQAPRGFYIPRLYSAEADRFENEEEDGIPCLDLCAKFCTFKEQSGLLAVGDEHGRVTVYLMNTANKDFMLCRFVADYYGLNDIAWVASGQADKMNLVTGGASNAVSMWCISIKEKKATKIWTLSKEDSSPVACLASHPNVPGVVVIGFDNGQICTRVPVGIGKTIYRPHPRKSANNKHPTDREEAITSLFLQSQDILISAGNGDKFVQVWDLKKIKTPIKTYPVKNTVTSITMNRDDHLFYVSCIDSSIYCFDITTKFKCSEALYHFVGHKVNTLYVKISISPCGGYLASGSSDGCVYIWSTNATVSSTKKPKSNSKQSPVVQVPQYTPVAKLHGHNQEVTSVDWTHNAENIMLVSASDDSTHRVWRMLPEGSPPNVMQHQNVNGYVEILDTSFEELLSLYKYMPARDKKQVKAKQAKQSVYKAAGKVKKPAHKRKNNINNLLAMMLFGLGSKKKW